MANDTWTLLSENFKSNDPLEIKRSYILKTLEWFQIPFEKLLKIHEALKKDKYISIPAYLDKYLIPLISNFYRSRETGVHLRGFISLCFKGDLSSNAWDKVWNYLDEAEKLFYATTEYYLGYPVEIATSEGNLYVLARLDRVYQDLISKYPQRQYFLHLDIRTALLKFPTYTASSNRDACYQFLLEMCERYSTTGKSNPNKSIFTNKEFKFCIRGIFFGEGATSLIDVFLEICQDYFIKSPKWEIGLSLELKLLCQFFLAKSMTLEEYQEFKDKLLSLLEKHESYSEESYRECWKEFEDLAVELSKKSVKNPPDIIATHEESLDKSENTSSDEEEISDSEDEISEEESSSEEEGEKRIPTTEQSSQSETQYQVIKKELFNSVELKNLNNYGLSHTIKNQLISIYIEQLRNAGSLQDLAEALTADPKIATYSMRENTGCGFYSIFHSGEQSTADTLANKLKAKFENIQTKNRLG